ncbi:MAG: hypothetical protein GY795_41975 [Desulfobacterales bacterium]|nr:hypothetical protein [Desulfobacterales bacterium]
MWFPPINKLSKVNKSTAFILLCWAELFDEAPVPVSYGFRLLNSYGLLHELKDIALNAEKDERWISHIPFIVKELQRVSEHDNVIKKYYPHVSHMIKELSGKGENSVALVYKTAAIALSLIEEKYPERIRETVREALKNMPKGKKEMLESLQALATLSQSEKVPHSQCAEVVSKNNLSLSPSEITELIIESSTPVKNRWFCIITLKGDKSVIQSFTTNPQTNFESLLPQNKPLGKIGTKFLKKTEDTERITPNSEIEANGPFNAILIATRELRANLDILNFYSNAFPIQIGDYAFASCGQNQKLISLREQHYHSKLKPKKGMARNLILQVLSDYTSSAPLPYQLQYALEQHTIAYSSADLKVMFINLWIALEILVGGSNRPSAIIGKEKSNRPSIISKITEYVTPCVVSYQLRDQIKYLSICLHDFGFNKFIPDKSKFFSHSLKRKKILPDELLIALAGKGGYNVQKELYEATRCHPLLLFRLYFFWEQLGFKKDKQGKQSSKPSYFVKQLEESYQRTEWQLRRIYRARNLLVHQGIERNEFPYLLERLKYYFSATLQRIINEHRRHPDWTVNDCFEYKRMQYDYLIDCLKNKPENIKVFDIIKEYGPYKDERLFTI